VISVLKKRLPVLRIIRDLDEEVIAMASRNVEEEHNLRRTMLEDTWNMALMFEAAYTASDKSDWYEDARNIRGGFAMSSTAPFMLSSFRSFALSNVPIRQKRRRLERTAELDRMFKKRAAEIDAATEVWRQRARAKGVTLPEERPHSEIALYADAELRDLYSHLKSGRLDEMEFQEKAREVTEKFRISPAKLTEWQDSQNIHF
jgi:hypothetical protein